MPFNLNVPLPGPFTYSKRLGGRRKPGEHGVLWWLVIGWWWMPCWWLLRLMWVITVFVGRQIARWVDELR